MDSKFGNSDTRTLLGSVAEDLERWVRNDISIRSPVSRGMLKKRLSLLFKPNIAVIGSGEECRLSEQGGEWVPTIAYDPRWVDRFVDNFTLGSSAFHDAAKNLESHLNNSDEPVSSSELHLTLLSHKLLGELLTNGPYNDESVDSFLANFTADIEANNILILVKLGLDGIRCSEQSLMLRQEKDDKVLIRQPRPEDANKPIVVVPYWNGDWDIQGEKYLPLASSVIELRQKRIRITPSNIGLNIRLFNSIRVFDWLIQNIYPRINETASILELFQSRVSVRPLYLELEFFLDNLSPNQPVYECKIPFKKYDFELRDHFAITRSNKDLLHQFWNRMLDVGFMEKLYGPPRTSPFEHRSRRPIEIAFRRYRTILKQDEESQVKIHDAVEALEGFFTPTRYPRKGFIPRFTTMMRILKTDENRTDWRLAEAFTVRSVYSHQAAGWEDDETDIQEDLPPHRRIRNYREIEHVNGLAKLSLNYLRIALLARIVSGLSDSQFVALLDDRTEARRQLEPLLVRIGEMAKADSFTKIRAPLTTCKKCGSWVPRLAIGYHAATQCKKKPHQSKPVMN